MRLLLPPALPNSGGTDGEAGEKPPADAVPPRLGGVRPCGVLMAAERPAAGAAREAPLWVAREARREERYKDDAVRYEDDDADAGSSSALRVLYSSSSSCTARLKRSTFQIQDGDKRAGQLPCHPTIPLN